jgi:hypothetical protein
MKLTLLHSVASGNGCCDGRRGRDDTVSISVSLISPQDFFFSDLTKLKLGFFVWLLQGVFVRRIRYYQSRCWAERTAEHARNLHGLEWRNICLLHVCFPFISITLGDTAKDISIQISTLLGPLDQSSALNLTFP